jgi:hypothetical protein
MMDKKERTNERTPLFHDSKETERIDDDLDIGTARQWHVPTYLVTLEHTTHDQADPGSWLLLKTPTRLFWMAGWGSASGFVARRGVASGEEKRDGWLVW